MAVDLTGRGSAADAEAVVWTVLGGRRKEHEWAREGETVRDRGGRRTAEKVGVGREKKRERARCFFFFFVIRNSETRFRFLSIPILIKRTCSCDANGSPSSRKRRDEPPLQHGGRGDARRDDHRRRRGCRRRRRRTRRARRRRRRRQAAAASHRRRARRRGRPAATGGRQRREQGSCPSSRLHTRRERGAHFKGESGKHEAKKKRGRERDKKFCVFRRFSKLVGSKTVGAKGEKKKEIHSLSPVSPKAVTTGARAITLSSSCI